MVSNGPGRINQAFSVRSSTWPKSQLRADWAYYEDAKFSARVSASYRSKYIDQNSGTGNIFEGYNSTVNVDASVRYKLTDWIELSLEGINLTDDYRDRYTDLDANRNYEQLHFGRTIQLGARFKL